MPKEKPYVNLHNHSDYSLLDGAQKCAELAGRSKEMGHTAVGLTDHGTMRGFYKFHTACQDEDIRPIFGFEAYACFDRHRRGVTAEEKEQIIKGIPKKREQNAAIKLYEQEHGIRARQHLCLMAKNDEGMRNLFRLSSIGYTEGFYYRPRIDLDAVRKHTEGVLCMSACVSGILAHHFVNGDLDEMVRTCEIYKEMFGEDFYLEIMPHDFDEQREVNKAVVSMANAFDIPLVATNDAHYCRKADWERHEVILCMQSKDVWSNPNRWKFETKGFHLRSRTEMWEAFRKWHPDIDPKHITAALDNTVEVAEKCQAEVVIDRKKCLLPPVQIADEHLDEFMEWTHDNYPEAYKMIEVDQDTPNIPCHLDCDAPSAADDDGIYT